MTAFARNFPWARQNAQREKLTKHTTHSLSSTLSERDTKDDREYEQTVKNFFLSTNFFLYTMTT